MDTWSENDEDARILMHEISRRVLMLVLNHKINTVVDTYAAF